ncbi:MAG TPA: inorganic diphosphatase [Candidatus Blautia gallistercoris]|uniref:inorganic diphosphatase n=1 Tax=Candidatus Blautia gallistercoris TaxID=2838490 RepID=A0A9D2B395_9FIRM|nr:inorganic diphosphatase [Candidatus Blautia gallistercoris]
MNIWHNVSEEKVTPGHFPVYIEISKGSNKRYEFDKDTGCLALVQILYSAACYPVNVGIIPRTMDADGVPVEVWVVCQEILDINTIVECSPVGIIKTQENGKIQKKVIALPIIDSNASLGMVERTEALKGVYEEIKYFFNIFNGPEEEGTWSGGALNGLDAFTFLEESIARYKKKYGKAVLKEP